MGANSMFNFLVSHVDTTITEPHFSQEKNEGVNFVYQVLYTYTCLGWLIFFSGSYFLIVIVAIYAFELP